MEIKYYRKIIEKLSSAQLDALGVLATEHQVFNKKIISSLLKKGLIASEDVFLADRYGTFKDKFYYVPLIVHIAWSEFCCIKDLNID